MKTSLLLFTMIAFLFSGSTVNASESVHSNEFPTSLLKRPAKPVITSHTQGSSLNDSDVIRGTGEAGNQIELTFETAYKGGKDHLGTHVIQVDPNGLWYFNNPGLWLPAGASNAEIRISAVQLSPNMQRSRPAKLTLTPGTGILEIRGGLLNEQADGMGAPVERGGTDIIVRDFPPSQFNTLPIPEIISPKHLSQGTDKKEIRIIGTGTPGAGPVIVRGLLTYYASDKAYDQSFELEVEVDDRGIWVTPYITPNIPKDAMKGEYSISAFQKDGDEYTLENRIIVFRFWH